MAEAGGQQDTTAEEHENLKYGRRALVQLARTDRGDRSDRVRSRASDHILTTAGHTVVIVGCARQVGGRRARALRGARWDLERVARPDAVDGLPFLLGVVVEEHHRNDADRNGGDEQNDGGDPFGGDRRHDEAGELVHEWNWLKDGSGRWAAVDECRWVEWLKDDEKVKIKIGLIARDHRWVVVRWMKTFQVQRKVRKSFPKLSNWSNSQCLQNAGENFSIESGWNQYTHTRCLSALTKLPDCDC